jgi:uncharacterized protein
MTKEEIYKLHQKYCRGINEKMLLDVVWTHSLIVRDIALELAKNLEKRNIKIDKKLLEIGALVHDIGCYRCYEFYGRNEGVYVQHGVKGYEILKNEGFSEEIARMAEVHLGVGIIKENIIQNSLPLEEKDYIPMTLEEELVAYADNFHSKSGPRFLNFKEAREKMLNLWVESEVIFERFEKKFGKPDLEKLEKKYGKWQEEIKEKIRNKP